MNTPTAKYLIILAVLVIIGGIGWNWHNDQITSAKREAEAKLEGQNIILIQQSDSLKELLKTQQVQMDKLTSSTNQSIHDTIRIYSQFNANSNKVKNLGINSSISYLANRLK